MNKRLELHEKLCDILGSRQVYFQPPESIHMQYPAIVYELDTIDKIYANDQTYRYVKRYSITLIHPDPDNDIVDQIIALPMCRFDRQFVSSNLNQYIFEIFY